MSDSVLADAVTRALSRVVNPTDGVDVVTGEQVTDVTVGEEGEVRFAFALRRGDPGTLAREVRAAAAEVDGVKAVKVDVRLPRAAAPGGGGAGGGTAGVSGAAGALREAGGSGPARGVGAGQRAAQRGLQPGSVPAPTPAPGVLADVKRIVAVSSGKGGVGKSMVATNLAAHAAAQGWAVGLMDADIYGPNIPVMFGEERRPAVSGAKGSERIVPLRAHGVSLMSLGFLLEREQPAIMRGPLIAGILKQFVEQVAWGALDLMVVDMPPGTGDAQLSLVQTVELQGAVMVTTPQKVATGDVRRGIKMFERVNTRVLGVVENMRGFQLPGSDAVVDLFGRGGGEELAAELSVPFLGAVPLDLAVRKAGDEGKPTVLSAPDSPAGVALRQLGDRVIEALEGVPPRS